MGKGKWTGDELQIMRDSYGRIPRSELAAKLGRTDAAVRNMAKKMNMCTGYFSRGEFEEITKLNKDGYGDKEIGEKLGRTVWSIMKHRRRLGLPSNRWSWRFRAKQSSSMKRSAEFWKPLLLSQRKIQDEKLAAETKKYASISGFPEWLRSREIQILNILAAVGVPISMSDLSSAMDYQAESSSHRYFHSLLAAGLIVKIKGYSKGKSRFGKAIDGYTLGPVALKILKERADEKIKEQNWPDDGSRNGGNSSAGRSD